MLFQEDSIERLCGQYMANLLYLLSTGMLATVNLSHCLARQEELRLDLTECQKHLAKILKLKEKIKNTLRK